MNQLLPAPGPADIGILAALPIEVGPFLDQLQNVRKYADPQGRRRSVIEGELDGQLLAVVLAGVGARSAQVGIRRLLDGHRPRWIVSTGFGGALHPDWHRNDVVLANEVIGFNGERLAIDVSVPESSANIGGSRIRSGRLLTIDHIVRTAAEKATLRDRYGADLVDMETLPVAQACSDRGVRFLSVRVISDEAGTDLPSEILSVVGPTGSFRLGATLGALWKRPGSIKDLWTLREHAMEAADRLAEILPGLLQQLS